MSRSRTPGPTPAAAAELTKLGHTLGVGVERLEHFAAVPAEDLRALRRQIADALFEADRPRFAKIAALAKAVPVSVAAKMTELTFPPLLAARTAEVIDPPRAVEMVGRLSDRYLADVSAAMDPARAREVVSRIPAERIATVARELARRGEWVAIAGFIDQVSGDALAASVAEFDGAQLLHIGFVLDDKDRLGLIHGLLSEAQRDDILTAADTEGLWAELDVQIAHLPAEGRAGLARRFAAAPAPVRANVTQAVTDGRLSRASAKVFGA